MEFPHLDRLFDESMQRAETRGPLVSNPYGGTPLAADHFLLKKSWDYFRSRVKSIEDQWKKILQSKDEQITMLKAELRQAKERAVELEDENLMVRSLDQSVKKARVDDHVGFARGSEGMRLRWEAERESLQRKIEEFEMKAGRAQKENEGRFQALQARDNKKADEISALQRELSQHADRERDIELRWSEHAKAQAEAIQALETKVEILKNEVDRRDQLIRQMKETISNHEKDAHAMVQYVAELQRSIREKETELGHSKIRLDILRQEKETMRLAWQREQAEWRELWDRGREAWEHKK